MYYIFVCLKQEDTVYMFLFSQAKNSTWNLHASLMAEASTPVQTTKMVLDGFWIEKRLLANNSSQIPIRDINNHAVERTAERTGTAQVSTPV